ncbi:MAG: DUF2243 domain-containing protein [Streptosporangiales bacterium]|nr:DUF2243 domain-containing protein [Streptosporangiales bacterium]
MSTNVPYHLMRYPLVDALAGLRADTTAERVGVVLLGAAVVALTLGLAWRFFYRSFFNGFLVAVGVFFSFDVVVFHWVFQLHRITECPEANVIEPLLVALGIGFVTYGLMRERSKRRVPPGG